VTTGGAGSLGPYPGAGVLSGVKFSPIPLTVHFPPPRRDQWPFFALNDEPNSFLWDASLFSLGCGSTARRLGFELFYCSFSLCLSFPSWGNTAPLPLFLGAPPFF